MQLQQCLKLQSFFYVCLDKNDLIPVIMNHFVAIAGTNLGFLMMQPE